MKISFGRPYIPMDLLEKSLEPYNFVEKSRERPYLVNMKDMYTNIIAH